MLHLPSLLTHLVTVIAVGRVKDFLRLLHKYEELLTHISQEPSQTISLDVLRVVLSQYYPGLNEDQISNSIKDLCTSEPFEILESIEDEVTFTLTEKVSNLLLWLSNRMYLVNDKFIETIVDEIRETTSKLSGELESMKMNIHVIDGHLEKIWRLMKQLRTISESNKRAIGTQTQDLRDQELDYELKVIRAQIISEYLEPMRELIDENSGIVAAVKETDLVLAKVRATYTIRDNVKEKAARLSTELGRTSRTMREDHINALITIQPFLDIYLKSQGDLVRGCNKAIALLNEFGPSVLRIHNKISLIRPKRPRNIISDANFHSWFRRVITADDALPDRKISGTNVTESYFPIPVKSTVVALRKRGDVEDLLDALLELYPNHSLSECNKAVIDLLIVINDFSRTKFAEMKKYKREEYEVEVRRVEIQLGA